MDTINTPLPPEIQTVNDLREQLASAIVARDKFLARQVGKMRYGETMQDLADRYRLNRTTVIMAIRRARLVTNKT